jgi:hypothetical protein
MRPAEERNPQQLALEDICRVFQDGDEREGLPQRLVLGGDQHRSLRNFLQPRNSTRAADTRSSQIGAGPESRDPTTPARYDQRRQRGDDLHRD